MIILAGAIILSLSNGNVIAKAKEAISKNDLKSYDEMLSLWTQKEYASALGNIDLTTLNVDKTSGTYVKDGVTTSVTLADILPGITGKKYENTIAINGGKLTYVGTDATEAKIANDSGILLYTTIKGNNKYNIPYIPTGFYYVGGSWNTGLVISDNITDFNKGENSTLVGNQFVWVPVKDGVASNGAYTAGDTTTVQYKKWCVLNFSVPYGNTIDESILAGSINETTQITNYGGFYIARYEAGKEGASPYTLVSKKNLNVWVYIEDPTAKTKAESMYATTAVKSGLITGKQWDTVMRWAQNSGKNVLTDSSSWGNYYQSVFTYEPNNTIHGAATFPSILNTGVSAQNSVNNIYDLAGNAYEWTNETDVNADRIYRSGVNGNTGSYDPAAKRDSYYHDYPGGYPNHSFRVVLYIV